MGSHKACASKPPTRRLTMGYRLLETARNAWVMGKRKGQGRDGRSSAQRIYLSSWVSALFKGDDTSVD